MQYAPWSSCEGLAEMTRLVVKKGGKASTITGLAGRDMDWIWPCRSSGSDKNWLAGELDLVSSDGASGAA